MEKRSGDRRTDYSKNEQKDDVRGEAESLFGKINPKEFGSNALREAVPEEYKTKVKEVQDLKKSSKESASKRLLGRSSGLGNILNVADGLEELVYQPRTKETRETYELLMNYFQNFTGDQPRDVIRGAVDEALVILKDESIKDFDKKKGIEELITATLSSDDYAILVNLARKITDYSTNEKNEEDDNDLEKVGVAVVFDEEEEENVFELDDEEEEEPNAEDKYSDDEQSTFEEEEKKDMFHVLIHEIDAFWLQRNISKYYKDAVTSQGITEKVFELLKNAKDARECENELVSMLDYDKFDLIKLLTKNRQAIVYGTLLAKANDKGKADILKQMKDSIDLMDLAAQYINRADSSKGILSGDAVAAMDIDSKVEEGPKIVDLEAMSFSQGNHIMSNTKVKLPEKSWKKTKKGYEEIHVPFPTQTPMAEGERLIPISEMPAYAQQAFSTAKSLNRLQSKLFKTAMHSDENVLCCAPTGAGKTNVAMMTILKTIGDYIDPDTGDIDVSSFKIIYIAPMKALVQEMVANFGNRLKDYGIKVAELTGDRQLTKAQISETQIIVTTPEKWDIITRKSNDRSYTQLVRLIIIDEIHLLHDERGPVLESIVSRTLRTIEETQQMVRLVGLSATLPNYIDVARFMRVNPSTGMFFFDNSYRPCPLQQQFIGITEKKAIKRFQLMNEITYEKVIENAGKNQVLIFVHSRRETAKTAKFVRDMAVEKQTIGSFLPQDSASKEILNNEAETTKNTDLKDLLPYGFGIHHAGMTRADRTLVEELFSEGHLKVLISTATLAWGVNLPAHTVIIKGTQVYNPEKGKWAELSPQDVLQMLGRAGRPQFDTFGEGIIITSHQELQYYLSLMNQQLPIESQFVSRLVDNLNAEIALGTVSNRNEAIDWLGYTYLYVRMLKDPSFYSISPEEFESDPFLRQKRLDLIHTACTTLDRCHLIKYDKRTGNFQTTELGRIASHYYVTHQSMMTYNHHLKPMMTDMDLFRIFAMSNEFKYIPVRSEEKMELAKLIERVPVPIKEGVEEPTAKINVLLQAYVSQLKLEGFALVSDMVYVTQSASRILRAMFEMCLRRGWATLSKKLLNLCKMVDRRMWSSMSPLRQFRVLNSEAIRKLERKDFPWSRYFDLSPQELGELIRAPKMGKTLHTLIQQFPKVQVQAHVQPITRSMLKIDLTLFPTFQYDDEIHGAFESFWVMVEDCDGERLLFNELFVVRQKYASEEHQISFTVPLYEPLAPNYFVSVISDRWLQSETKLPIVFNKMLLPEPFAPHTDLLDLQPLPIAALKNPEFESIYDDAGVDNFNPIQTQTFHSLYSTDDNVFIGASVGSGKGICAEIALIRWLERSMGSKCVFISPFESTAKLLLKNLRSKFKVDINTLTGETSQDLRLLDQSTIVVSTPEQWDVLSRRWKQRKAVQAVSLFVAFDLQLLGSEIGPVYEVIVSRMRYIAMQTERPIRIIGISTSVANAKDLGEWIGASPSNIYNFHPNIRAVPLEIHIQSFNIQHYSSLVLAMTKPCYNAIVENCASSESNAIVFVSGRKHARTAGLEFKTFALASGNEKRFLNCELSDIEALIGNIESVDPVLEELLKCGIGYIYGCQSSKEQKLVKHLYQQNAIQVLIVSKDSLWGLDLQSHLVVIMGTQEYEGKEHRYVDYSMTDVLQMMGCANSSNSEHAVCILMCPLMKKDFYKKFLHEALPVESHLDQSLLDHFNAEIVTKRIENKQDAVDWLTWTFVYRRMTKNPNYYNLHGVSQRHLSDHLSELVESTLNDLEQSKCITVEDDFDVAPLNLGMIAAYYNIHYLTIEMFSMSLTQNTKLRGLLEIICASAEFGDLPIRHHEEPLLEKLYDRLPVKSNNELNFLDPHLKCNVLLQSHFNRTMLPPDLEIDQKQVLNRIVSLIQACVDVISSNGWLNPAIAAMELSQMCIQAIWDRDSPLKQLPHFDNALIQKCTSQGVESVFDLMDLEDEDREKLLNFNEKQMEDVARAVNRYPSLEVSFSVEESEILEGEQVSVHVVLQREEETNSPVVAPFFPKQKEEAWWVIIGDPKDKTLLSIKRIVPKKTTTEIDLDFIAPNNSAGDQVYKIYVIADSYSGCDQEYDLPLIIKPNENLQVEDEEMEEE